MKYQTLHAHTTVSDGKLTHKEVLDECVRNNIGVVAFTEHDTVPDKKTLKVLQDLKGHTTKWIVGIEVSSGWPLDLGGGASSGVHIVGLFVDPFNKKLREYCVKAQEARILRMQKMVNNLKMLGFTITEEDCLRASGGEAVGRPHIVTALNYHEENKTIIEDLKKQMEKEAQNNKSIAEKYDEMINSEESQYPYMLFLGEDVYIKGIYVDYLYYLDFDKSVDLIRNAGGLAILAHWFSCRYKMTDDYVGKIFADNRLDGAETVYGLFNYGVGSWDKQEEELRIINNLVDKYGKLHSGGADAHTKEDFEQFAREKWFSERTIGLVEEIIEKSRVDTTWSSLKR